MLLCTIYVALHHICWSAHTMLSCLRCALLIVFANLSHDLYSLNNALTMPLQLPQCLYTLVWSALLPLFSFIPIHSYFVFDQCEEPDSLRLHSFRCFFECFFPDLLCFFFYSISSSWFTFLSVVPRLTALASVPSLSATTLLWTRSAVRRRLTTSMILI